jgi:hypothetical protein
MQSVTRKPVWHVYISVVELHFTLSYFRNDICLAREIVCFLCKRVKVVSVYMANDMPHDT